MGQRPSIHRIAGLAAITVITASSLIFLPSLLPFGSAATKPAPAPHASTPTVGQDARMYLPVIRGEGSTLPPVPTVPATANPTASPTAALTPEPTDWWRPSPDKPIAWHWQLSQEFVYPRDLIPSVTVYDIDGELTSAATVAQLHALGPEIIVICYFDAGVFEDYRSDAAAFPRSVIGKPDEGWEGSYWLDIRQVDILRPIMENRIKSWCKEKGFDAIEPDETEVWSNDSGFPITKAENNAYNQMIAELGHKYGLSVGLKGNTTETGELVHYFDWTLNEQCWEYDECDFVYNSFIRNGKAAFNIEYDATPDCTEANRLHLNSARRDLHLVGPTHPQYRFAPCVPYSQTTWTPIPLPSPSERRP